MPFLGRERGRSARQRRTDDEFVVFLQGIPAHCRWQELKDLVRQTALHIRQAVVYDDSHGVPTGLGQIIVKDEEDAWRTYHRLSTNGWEGQGLVVTLARTSAPTKPIAGPTSSPPAMMSSGYMSGTSTPPRAPGSMTMPPSPISPESIHPGSPTYHYSEYGPMVSRMAMSQQFMHMMPDPVMHCYPPSPMMPSSTFDALSWTMLSPYPMSPLQPLHEGVEDEYTAPFSCYHAHKSRNSHTDPGSPIFPLGQRTLSVQNLNTATTNADLKILLQGAGVVEECKVTVTSDVGRNRSHSYGTATMFSADEARRAVTMFNNMTFMGSRIRVRVSRASHACRGGSWDGGMGSSQADPRTLNLGLWECREEGRHTGSISTATKGRVDSCQPLVVDGSGLRNKSLRGLATSAPAG